MALAMPYTKCQMIEPMTKAMVPKIKSEIAPQIHSDSLQAIYPATVAAKMDKPNLAKVGIAGYLDMKIMEIINVMIKAIGAKTGSKPPVAGGRLSASISSNES